MNLNPRDLQKAMQRMGIRQEEIEAEQVTIRCKDKDIIITNPSVAKVNMMGQETWQVTGTAHEQKKDTTPEIKEEDIQTVMQQTGKNRQEALNAINQAKGDLAEAILRLSP
ncbi:nascent polypeptide-associated complex protein [Candidatus Woesearchaeota archaeon]|nr:nascent polypeptide-associated complex protein [Candidatus Woesearchaeota archaeon]